jgi:hypothetical protein
VKNSGIASFNATFNCLFEKLHCFEIVQVPSEETIRQIRDRYLNYNWHAASYTWKVFICPNPHKGASIPEHIILMLHGFGLIKWFEVVAPYILA